MSSYRSSIIMSFEDKFKSIESIILDIYLELKTSCQARTRIFF